jgi:hypothetical protein
VKTTTPNMMMLALFNQWNRLDYPILSSASWRRLSVIP